jgi:hypothetical protein
MSNPNIISVGTIVGNTSSFLVSSTSNPFATAMVNNAASSNKIYKINSIVVANVSSSACNVTINLYPQDDLAGTATAIASTISVPAYASLIVLDRTTTMYLLEDKSLGIVAGTSNALTVTTSWDEMS